MPPVSTLILLRNKLLCMFFGIPSWHARRTYLTATYKILAIELTTMIHATSYCDLGCGLGEIIRRIKPGSKKAGVDNCINVLRAARLLNVFDSGNKIDYINCDFLDSPESIPEASVYIIVNVAHDSEPSKVEKLLRYIVSNSTAEHIVMDIPSTHMTWYKYVHIPELLVPQSLERILTRYDPYDARQVVLYRLIRS